MGSESKAGKIFSVVSDSGRALLSGPDSTAYIAGRIPAQKIDDTESPFSPLYLYGFYRRQRKLVALLTLILGALLLFLVYSLKDRYSAETLVVLDQSKEQLVGTALGDLPSVDTEVEIMLSSSIVHQVAIRLAQIKAAKKKRQAVSHDDSDANNVRQPENAGENGDQISSANGAKAERKDDAGSEIPLITPVDIHNLRRRIQIQRRGMTSIISITATADNAQEAAALSRLYASVYLQEQVKSKLLSLEYAEKALRQRVADLGRELERSDAELAVRELYRNYISRLKSIRQKRQIVAPHARVVSLALPPGKPGFPKRKLFAVLAMMMAFGAAAGIAFIRDVHFSGVRSASELEGFTGVWNIGHINYRGDMSGKAARRYLKELTEASGGEFSRSIQQVWFGLKQLQKSRKTRPSLVVTAVGRDINHNFLALSIASAASSVGEKVVIVDGDTASPSLSQILNLKGRSVLAGAGQKPDRQTILNAIQTDSRTGIKLLSCGNSDTGRTILPPFLLENIIRQLENDFDLVIVVIPAISSRENETMYVIEAGMTLLIAEQEVSRPQEVRGAVQRLLRAENAMVVTALTEKQAG